MVKTVRMFLALFATLWYTTSPINSGSTNTIWVPPPAKVEPAVDLTSDYYKPLEFKILKYNRIAIFVKLILTSVVAT